MYKPMLAPNNKIPLKLEELKYPLLASYKLDGIRCEFIKGEILSRSLKPIVNKQLREKFKPLIDYSKENNIILDGEIYTHEIPFSLISSCVMTQDYDDKKSMIAWFEKCKEHGINISRKEALKTIKFNSFDFVKNDNFDEKFVDRIANMWLEFPSNLVKCVQQVKVNSRAEVEALFERALDDDFEGLILKDPNGRYKCGRGTIKEGLIYKVKPLQTTDAEIIDVIQGTNVKEGAEKKRNELDRSVTSKKLEDRVDNNMAKYFLVKYKNTTVNVSCSRMKHKQRKEVWNNKKEYIGKMIEYCFIPVGMKDKPRSPRFIRFREDKD